MMDLDDHYATVITAFGDGEVVPFLGAGINRCGRPQEASWEQGRYLPDGYELAEYLAEKFQYPGKDRRDLLRVSQYVAVMRGLGPLYRGLQEVFAADYPPTGLHDFLAALPGILKNKGCPHHLLIVTTNYDDALERAFRAAQEPFDLVVYMAEGRDRGKFLHCPPDGSPQLVDKPNEYDDISLKNRSVILKIHGAVDRAVKTQGSFVITEDHYIDFLTRTEISSLVPIHLAEKLRGSNYLFLGYSLRDWNLRVILRRIWGEQELTYQSWAIQLNPEQLEKRFWMGRGVEIIDQRLEDYLSALKERINPLTPTESGT